MEVCVHPCRTIVCTFDNTGSLLVHARIRAAFTGDPWRVSSKNIVSPGKGIHCQVTLAMANDSKHMHLSSLSLVYIESCNCRPPEWEIIANCWSKTGVAPTKKQLIPCLMLLVAASGTSKINNYLKNLLWSTGLTLQWPSIGSVTKHYGSNILIIMLLRFEECHLKQLTDIVQVYLTQ